MNPLSDVIPAKARKYVYAALALTALAYTAWQGAHGDWAEFAGGLVVSLTSTTAASNTNAE